MAASGIKHSVADLVRGVPAPAASATPKPTRRFDDILAGRRNAPKADAAPKPEGKAEPAATDAKPPAKPANKAKLHKADADASVDEITPTDETADVDDVDASDETDGSEDAAGPTAQDGKPVQKAALSKQKSKGEGEDLPPEDLSAEADAKPAEQKLPDVAPAEDAPLAIDDVEKATAGEKKKPGDTLDVSPDAAAAAAAALAQAAPAPTDAPPPPSTDAAAAPVAAAAPAPAAKHTAPTHSPAAANAAAASEPVIKPHAAKAAEGDVDRTADAEFIPVDADAPVEKPAAKTAEADVDPASLLQPAAHEKPAAHVALPAVAQPDAAPQRTVAEDNVDRIVTSVRGELLTKGGSMQIRLDPPSLGAINVQISVDDGVMTASLQTNNDEATRLLSHNLQQLKTSLESTGVTVDRIQVKQAAPAESSSSAQQNADGDRGQSGAATQDQSARQEQQRREMLQRMWAKLSGSGDPLDLVA